MQGFDSVIGHEEIIAHLQNAIRLDKVSHAYIFPGSMGQVRKCWHLCLLRPYSVRLMELNRVWSVHPVKRP